MSLDVCWVDASGDVLEHILEMGEVGVVKGLHPFDGHSVIRYIDGCHWGSRRETPAQEALAEG